MWSFCDGPVVRSVGCTDVGVSAVEGVPSCSFGYIVCTIFEDEVSSVCTSLESEGVVWPCLLCACDTVIDRVTFEVDACCASWTVVW